MIKLQPISQLRSLKPAELDTLAREAGSLETTMKNATKRHKSSFPAVGKIVCVIEERLNDLKTQKKVASNMSVATYWEETVTKQKGKGIRLNPHWYSCAVAFGTFVRSELISEKDYDDNTAANLELAASISTVVGGDITHDAIAQTAEELKHQTKNTRTNLQKILETVKTPEPMDAEKAEKLLARIFADGHLPVVIASVGAQIAHIDESEEARTAYFGMVTAFDMFAANTHSVDGKDVRRFPDDILNAWAAAYEKANAPAAQTAESAENATAETTTSETEAQPIAAAA